MPRGKIRTAVIGVGNMGRHHARIYNDFTDLVGVSDINQKLGEEVAAQYGTNYYSDYIQLLDQEKPEAVSLVVPTFLHAKIAKEIIERKIPLLVEKPISDNLNAGREMISLAKQNKTFLMVGHVERFNPAITKLNKLIDSGRLGEIVNLLSIRVGIAPPPTANSDVALDLAIHDADIFNYLLKDSPSESKVWRTKIFKHNIADSASIDIKYAYTTAHIYTNWVTPVKMRKLFVSGTAGYAELDFISQKINLYDKMIDYKKVDNYYEFIGLGKPPKKEVYVSKKEPLYEELKYFIANRNKYHNLEVAESALKALEMFC